MKIGIFTLDRSPAKGPSIMPEVFRLLSAWGAKVDAICPERRLTDISQVRVEHDLYILKAATDLVWSIAGAMHAAGARMINPYPSAAQIRDKIIASQILQEAGIPAPATYVTSRTEHLAPLLNDGPLVVKPYRGSQGRGVRKVWDTDELDEVPTDDGPVFAQRYHKPQGLDRKIYCIGGQLFGVERVWPARTYEEKLGKPFTIPAELRDIALRCGRAFGVDLFGMDVIDAEQPHGRGRRRHGGEGRRQKRRRTCVSTSSVLFSLDS